MSEISILYAYVDVQNGYGISASKLINQLNRLEGVEVDPLPLNVPNIQQEKKLKDHYDIFISHISPGSLVNDLQNNGYLKLAAARCKKKYQYVLWETDRLPSGIDQFYGTDYLDGFICPSEFTVGLVNKYKAQRKQVFYIPISANEKEYSPQLRKPTDTFNVLTVAQMSVRKAIDMSVCAFTTAFRTHPADVRYYIKIGEKIEKLEPLSLIRGNIARSMLPNHQNIYLIDRFISDTEMEELYMNSNCYLHLSRGEGFGMTPLDAISYGLPVIYTDWSAHSEFLSKDKNSIAVKGRLDLVHSMNPSFGFEPEMQWFEANLIDAVASLREMYDRWKSNKLKYNVPKVVDEYKDDAILQKVAAFLGRGEVALKNIKKIGNVSVIEM